MPKPKGSPKTGGRKPGTPNRPESPRSLATAQARIDKELQREHLRALVCAAMEPMTKAQIAHAQGVHYLVLRHKDGTFTRATDVKQLDAALAAGADTFEIFTQAPNTQAFTDLMNRALDKPAEQVKVTGEDGGPVEHVFRWAK